MADPLPLSDDALRLASVLTFADSEGGPLIAMSERALADWHGVYDAAGTVIYGKAPCDYDRACRAEPCEVIDVGGARAVVLETPDNGTLVAQPDGALIVRWVGADDAATLLSAALAAEDADFEKQPGDLVHDGTDLVLFDSASSGVRLDRKRAASIPLPAGTYGMRLLGEWSGPVLGSDGEAHDTMVQVLRLLRKA
jgi:hypothetical protein